MADPTPTERSPLRIRLAHPHQDGAGVAEVYRHGVEDSVASFETVAPGGDEMAERMSRVLRHTPWLVAVDGDDVVGYAYASRHHERAAYRWSVEVSAYVHPAWQRQGVGKRLYVPLFDAMRAQGFVNVYAGMTLPNEGSFRLHRSFGMEEVGVYRDVGYKFGRWHDVAWYGMRLQGPADPPREPVLLPAFLSSPEGQAWLTRMAGGASLTP